MAAERWLVSPTDPDARALASAATAIREGRVLVFPTDTFYGLAADPRNAAAVSNVFEVKGRARGEALPLVAGDLEQAGRAAVFTPLARRLAAVFWPGPLTLVLEARPGMAPEVGAGSGTVAVRVPAHEVARRLASAAGFPITSTSANRSGEPPSTTAEDAAAGVGGRVAVLDAGRTPGGAPSTIVDARGSEPRLIREGSITFERVLSALEG